MPDFYTCFLHPVEVREENRLADPCPECGRPYDFPLREIPSEIGTFRVLRHLGRGFYGATFLVESGNLGHRDVLKVVPTAVYEHFHKDFVAECLLHREVATETEHVVTIRDRFDEVIEFGGCSIPCHIAVLDYVQGISLAEFISDEAVFTARAAAQVAIDLLRLLQELEAKGRFHNDLHADNIRVRQLGPEARRADAVDESVRAVAIDLGSLSDASKSDPGGVRLGDLHEVAAHLLSMSERLLRDPDAIDDLEYRLAHALREIGLLLSPDALRARISLGDCEQMINDAALFAISPWAPPGEMKRFSDAFNAQTMHPWFVPRLLVDPDDEWLGRVSKPMPTLISGMRGCGKTMLLRALQFHARASDHEDSGGPEAARKRIQDDDYVGLYVSCNRLLDGLGAPNDTLHEPYARLFVAYAREAVQAARHLRELDRGAIKLGYHRLIARVVADHLSGAEDLADIASEATLERALQQHVVSLAKGDRKHSLRANPAVAFPQLAEAVRRCSPLWANSTVLFLLDDVSTRHLNKENIEQLMSSLLFKDETCAFKFTTEAQTLELLLSPGLIEKLHFGRDVDPFDLGAEVNLRLRAKGPSGGRHFISDILNKRARQLRTHPGFTPEALLGNGTLESIAQSIASGGGQRKETYHGITALTAVCVGDIGDVISLYEQMLRRWQQEGSKSRPISREIQSVSYQNYGVRRLYHLNRRDPWLRDIALSFARASNQLLTNSHKKRVERGRGRLRQFATMHINVAGADVETFEKLKELIDASVFVFEGGPDAPRLKTSDSDPVTQFILTFRKLYGVSSYIGLSERDRFELSAKDLAKWFSEPKNETLLTSKQGGAQWHGAPPTLSEQAQEEDQDRAGRLFDDLPTFTTDRTSGAEDDQNPADRANRAELDRAFVTERIAHSRRLAAADLRSAGIATVVAGLGFEERALASARELFGTLAPRRSLLVGYAEDGFGAQIEALAREAADQVSVVSYEGMKGPALEIPPGPVLVDVTGLPKPLIFTTVRNMLRRDGRVYVTHTKATTHYPLNEDIRELRERDAGQDAHTILEAARNEIFSGDRGPYTHQMLLPGGTDDSRRRLLCAGASAKHERLLSLLDERQYDRLELLVPNNDSPRTWLAQQAAEVARREADTASVEHVDSDDLEWMLEFMARRYRTWYGVGGFDVELGLTGSKIEAVAAAALTATLKIAQCWYVKPDGFEADRFSKGVGATRHFEISLPPEPGSVGDDPRPASSSATDLDWRTTLESA